MEYIIGQAFLDISTAVSVIAVLVSLMTKRSLQQLADNGAQSKNARPRPRQERPAGTGSARAPQDDAAAGGTLWALPPLRRLHQAEAEQGEVTCLICSLIVEHGRC